MKRKNLIISLALGLFTAGIMMNPIMAVEGLDGATEEALYDLMATMYPPQVWDVSVDPEAPADGEPVTITADIYNDPDLTDDEIMDAWVLYSTDQGESWDEILMDSSNYMTWTAEIPGQPSGAEVWWMIRADDTSMNIYIETPCFVTDPADGQWPIDDPCLVSAAAPDGSKINVPEDLDIVGFAVGESEKYVYGKITVKGKVTDGRVSPMSIQGYGGALVNPDRGSDDILDSGLIYLFAPLARLANFDECLSVIQRAGEAIYGKHSIECKRDGREVMFQIEKDYMGENPSKYYKFIALTAEITSIDPPSGAPGNWTRVTTMARVQRHYTVQ